ncbi:GNAT family N-acetyltransferase [bacterium]|nr:GNAT family N-acetyltransferase [bacterium]
MSTVSEKSRITETEDGITFHRVDQPDQFPDWAPREEVVLFLHHKMKPYHDSIPDIERALDYALSDKECEGGFIMLTKVEGELVGVLTMLKTGMGGYIPENILLFVSVDPSMRGRGIGGKLCMHCINQADGDVKLHVEYDNPAKRLYERLGFTTKYAEMRYVK